MSKYVKEPDYRPICGSGWTASQDALLVNVVGLTANAEQSAARRAARQRTSTCWWSRTAWPRRATEGTPLAPVFEGVERHGGHLLGRRGHRQPGQGSRPSWPRTRSTQPFEARGGVMDGERLSADAGRRRSASGPAATEQLSLLVGQILGPGATLVSQLIGPGGALASQIEQKAKGRRTRRRRRRQAGDGAATRVADEAGTEELADERTGASEAS